MSVPFMILDDFEQTARTKPLFPTCLTTPHPMRVGRRVLGTTCLLGYSQAAPLLLWISVSCRCLWVGLICV